MISGTTHTSTHYTSATNKTKGRGKPTAQSCRRYSSRGIVKSRLYWAYKSISPSISNRGGIVQRSEKIQKKFQKKINKKKITKKKIIKKRNIRKFGTKHYEIWEKNNIGGSRGGVRDARPPLGVQILSISCSFREILACSCPPWRVHAPPSGKSWIRHWTISQNLDITEGQNNHRNNYKCHKIWLHYQRFWECKNLITTYE